MIRKTHIDPKLIPIIVFVAFFVSSIVLFYAWRGEYNGYFPNVNDMAAALYLFPLNCILGTAIVLYVAELFGAVRIKRFKAMSIVLIVVIGVVLVWLMLLIASVHGEGDYKLLGNGIQSFISLLPNSLVPIQLSLFLQVHINDYLGMLIYEIIGIGLFVAIGSKKHAEIGGFE